MSKHVTLCALGTSLAGILAGCSSPFAVPMPIQPMHSQVDSFGSVYRISEHVPRDELSAMVFESNPLIASANHRIEEARLHTNLAHRERYPDITIGLDYIVTAQGSNPSLAESGDAPVMLSFGLSLPIWDEKLSRYMMSGLSIQILLGVLFCMKNFDPQSPGVALCIAHRVSV